MKSSQLALFQADYLREMGSKSHGGSLRKGRRKTRRPFDERKPLHLVLRAECAVGARSMLRVKFEKQIASLVRQEAKRSGVKLYRYVNVGNHLHLIVLPVKRAFFQRFLRVISGKIARLVTGAEKNRPFGRFWDGLAFSRVLEWGRDFTSACGYLIRNEIEALGWSDLLPKKAHSPPKAIELTQRGLAPVKRRCPSARA